MPEQEKVVIYRAGSVTSSTDYSSRAYISEDQFDDGDLIEVRSGGVAAETVIAAGAPAASDSAPSPVLTSVVPEANVISPKLSVLPDAVS